ncbi:MAG TPA: hypothetical protein VNP20_14180 [Nocardioidaceae bacterium]|nr:hypothetical protein [Nocardioidaceae bacterium]
MLPADEAVKALEPVTTIAQAAQAAQAEVLAEAYRSGLAHTGNLRTVVRHLKPCGLAVLQAHETQLLLATQAGPREIDGYCRHLADHNHPTHRRHRHRRMARQPLPPRPLGPNRQKPKPTTRTRTATGELKAQRDVRVDLP